MEAKAKSHEAMVSRTEGKVALDHAIAAAECFMKAANGAPTPTDKTRLQRKCHDLVSLAERLKKCPRVDTVAAVAKRLHHPRVVRDFPISEKTILLRGSHLHGNKFPPWDSDPDPKEFEEPVYSDPADFLLSERQLEVFGGWKRPAELISGLGLDPLTTKPRQEDGDFDLVQDITTDCSVVASLCASMRHIKPGPKSLLPALMFPADPVTGRPRVSRSGKYVFRMYFNGCNRKVVVDDRLPSSSNDRALYVVDRQDPTLVWPALIEKAYLKVRGGYDFPGSNSGTDLWVLTGWIPQQIFLQCDDVDFNQMWRRVKNAYDYGDVVVTLGTGRFSIDEEEALGLAGEHDYAVLDISETPDSRRLLVKNPWCDGLVWKGVGASGAEPTAARGQPAKLKPGTFWISFDDVAQNFESLYLNWNPSLFTERQDHHFTWKPPAANLANAFVHNPQYSMEAQEDGSTWILLSRHFQDEESRMARGDSSGGGDGSGQSSPTTLRAVSNRLGFMSLYIFDKSNGKRVQLGNKAAYRGPFVDSPQTLAPFETKKGARYTVAVATQELPLPEYSFTLSFFSRCPLAVRPAQDSLAHYVEVQGCWSRRTAGGNAASPTYIYNPQYSLAVPAPGPLSLLLLSTSPGGGEDVPVHVDLVWAGGRRVTTALTQRDLVADSGDYRRGCAVADIPSVDRGVYTVVVSTFEPGHVGDFTLRVGSGVISAPASTAAPCTLTPVPADAAGRLRAQLPDLVFGAGSNPDGPGSNGGGSSKRRAAISAARLTRASIVVTARRPPQPLLSPHHHQHHQNHPYSHHRLSPPPQHGDTIATFHPHRPDPPRSSSSSSSSASTTRAHATVRVTVERGRGPDRAVLCATGGGAFKELGHGLRTPEFDVDPRQHTGLWLVAEQIGGGGGGGKGAAAAAAAGSQYRQEEEHHPDVYGDDGDEDDIDAGLQVEVFSDGHMHFGPWEVVE